MVPAAQQREFVSALLGRVGLSAAVLDRYPHQFSGGQRARVGIARALAVNPELLVCDESVAALDVSIQAQVLNLFMKLREDLGLTYLFISHDLGVVKHISDEVVIMYLVRVVESGPTDDVFERQFHPYTVALLRAAPTLDSGRKASRAGWGQHEVGQRHSARSGHQQRRPFGQGHAGQNARAMRCPYRSLQSDSSLRCCGFFKP